jgi:hypothetical protein
MGYTSRGEGFEYAGHISEKYIRHYKIPSHEEKEATLEELFG